MGVCFSCQNLRIRIIPKYIWISSFFEEQRCWSIALSERDCWSFLVLVPFYKAIGTTWKPDSRKGFCEINEQYWFSVIFKWKKPIAFISIGLEKNGTIINLLLLLKIKYIFINTFLSLPFFHPRSSWFQNCSFSRDSYIKLDLQNSYPVLNFSPATQKKII